MAISHLDIQGRSSPGRGSCQCKVLRQEHTGPVERGLGGYSQENTGSLVGDRVPKVNEVILRGP